MIHHGYRQNPLELTEIEVNDEPNFCVDRSGRISNFFAKGLAGLGDLSERKTQVTVLRDS